MKQFRKNLKDHYICEECGKSYKSKPHLCIHINKYHNPKHYHDIWLKEENEGSCIICNKSTKFISAGQGYKNCCSKKCSHEYNHIQIDKSVYAKYGVKNISQLQHVKKKKEKTCLKNNGAKNVLQLPHVKELAEKAIFKKYGVRNPSQNKNIFQKQQKSRFSIKKFKDTNLTYQGSYELDFLEKFYDKIDIENGPSIPYLYEEKNKVYHSDFYIPSKNLVIEIKSDYILTLDNAIKEKKKATISNDFNYILILNKNYSELEKLYL